MKTLEEIHAELSAIAAAEGGPMWHDRPERWWDDIHWRCENEHVSRRYLKSEERGDLCLACFGHLVLTFPEDRDGPLVAPVRP